MDINKKPHWLLGHSSNTYSQTGEDGIIAKILSLLPETDRWCVEFGAWDGIHLSNVRKLILESQYNAVMIEGDASKFQLLKNNYCDNENVRVVNAFVGFERRNSLDKILSSYEIPKDFDFLSIDIDGNDYCPAGESPNQPGLQRARAGAACAFERLSTYLRIALECVFR